MKHLLILSGIILTAVIIARFMDTAYAAREVSMPLRSKSESHSATKPVMQLERSFPELREPAPVVEKTRHWQRELRPFPVTIENAGYGWTANDGKAADVMEALANNSVMLAALELENEEILRRQLLYVPESFSATASEIYRGQKKEVTLPGLDGEVFQVELTHNFPHNPEQISGSFAGKVIGVPDSEVTAASENDTWSIGITLPERHYQITTRERGEWIIVQRDPNYVSTNTECGCCENGEHEVGKAFIPSHSVDNVGVPFGS